MSKKFIGFNTIGRIFPPFRLTGVELIKRDLLNHFQTRVGERVMNPEFGTIIYDLLMNPQDAETRRLIIEEAVRVVSTEPRVTLADVDVQEYEQSIVVAIDLIFTPDRVRDSLYVTYKLNIENTA